MPASAGHPRTILWLPHPIALRASQPWQSNRAFPRSNPYVRRACLLGGSLAPATPGLCWLADRQAKCATASWRPVRAAQLIDPGAKPTNSAAGQEWNVLHADARAEGSRAKSHRPVREPKGQAVGHPQAP